MTGTGSATHVQTSAGTNAAALTAEVVRAGLVAILRSATVEHDAAVTKILVGAGVRVIEITLTGKDSVSAVERLSSEYAGSDVLVGAGTVVLAVARIADMAVFPGALTPTEVVTAHRGGASVVKLFPASALSPRYLADIRAPLPDVTIMPTGGIDLDSIPRWLDAGAGAVGLGSPLLGRSVTDGPDAGLAGRARRTVDAVAAAQGAS